MMIEQKNTLAELRKYISKISNIRYVLVNEKDIEKENETNEGISKTRDVTNII